ncbi:TonB-dependent receptor [Bacteroides nordii]|nr:TonB-dependent receptor [Bacteroides nordii]MCG4770894.1 carboxypeptidase-like regulatory domain-containing protein [Bacteroides nordii]
MLSGKIISTETKETIDFATVYLKGTTFGCTTNEKGIYHLKAPAGHYTLVVSAVGFETVEKKVELTQDERNKLNIMINPATTELDEVVVTSTGVSRIKRSAFNAVAVDTKELQNTTKNLSDALTKAPGMKLRESGGVGSDMQLMLDGFSGKHVKVFIDGVPQEGVGSSFGLNNIPVNFADRIEVYKGVVPVGFGTDAIGGVINIVTNKKRQRWFLDASYSYGSFNTHKSYANFGQTFNNGFTYEINAFQNYSDNDYYVDSPVEDFETGRIDRDKKVRVKRFNDTYHNEAVIGKLGVVDKKWADRLMFGFTYSNMYKDIQTGVRQEIVYGQKHRKGHSLMPSLEYNKRNLFTRGLDVVLTANYNKNMTTNVDTASYKYNWYGDKKLLNSPGEQSNQYSKADNNNWNGTLTLNYRIGKAHMLTFNHVLNTFHRSNTSLLAKEEQKDAIAKETRKNISGLSYRLMPSEKWNLSVFGKYYDQFVAGPIATTTNQDKYARTTRSINSMGYGAAGTYFILSGLQVKVSYEKAYRLPTIEEMFGDEDLEMGDIGIKPESSDNLNLNLSYNKTFGKHSVYIDGGLIYRNTKDYIQRNIADLSGGKYAATYINYGKVLTKGYNISARYGFGKWLSIGGNFTQMNVRDNMKTSISSSAANLAYGERMPNLPYMFADSDVSFYWRNLWKKGNTLTMSYDNQYLHSFTYYSSNLGSNKGDYVVPNQFSHNLALSYSLQNGRYNISFECRNFTNEKLYDNFSLQKAGRAFYGKVRIHFGN